MTQHEARGVHLLADLDLCAARPDARALAQLLRDAALAGGASVIGVHTHDFASVGGVAGVAVLAESHISVHTWPEFAFAAVDVFMCGAETHPKQLSAASRKGLAAGKSQDQAHRSPCRECSRSSSGRNGDRFEMFDHRGRFGIKGPMRTRAPRPQVSSS